MGPALDVPELERELDQRIALLRRYRRMMELQRERLQDYLVLLDTREAAVRADSYESLEEYTLKEQQVIKGIMAVQSCLQPLASMYVRIFPEGSPDVDELARRLENLRKKVLERNSESRDFLKAHARKLQTELHEVRARTRPRGVFGESPNQLVNMEA